MPKRALGSVVGNHLRVVTAIRTPAGQRTDSTPGKGGVDGSGAWSGNIPALGIDRLAKRLVGCP